MTSEPAPRRVSVPAERLVGWLERFARGHGAPTWDIGPTTVRLHAPDGTGAVLTVPFPPLVVRADHADGGLVDHVVRERRVGVLLVRKGGYAAGVFAGAGLLSSKVGSRLVQGRSAAGGSSQQRFARRRDNQAREAYAAAAACAVRVLLPYAASLEAVVLGGDRRALDAVLADPRLAALRPLVSADVLTVPDPRHGVLVATPDRFRAVPIDLSDSAPG